MPSATGQSWEKYKKEFADDEELEKKITPLTDEYDACHRLLALLLMIFDIDMIFKQGYTSTQDVWCSALCSRSQAA